MKYSFRKEFLCLGKGFEHELRSTGFFECVYAGGDGFATATGDFVHAGGAGSGKPKL